MLLILLDQLSSFNIRKSRCFTKVGYKKHFRLDYCTSYWVFYMFVPAATMESFPFDCPFTVIGFSIQQQIVANLYKKWEVQQLEHTV
jgi:hypothetical protein